MNSRTLKTLIRIVALVMVLAIGVFIAWRMIAARPVVPQRPVPPTVVTIDVRRLEPTTYQVMLPSRGVVSAPVRTPLAAEVSGRVISVSSALQDGQFFKAGDVLVELDPQDYQLEVQRLEQELVQAKANLNELDAEVEGNERQIKLAQRRAGLQRTRLDREQRLTRRGVSSPEAQDVVERDDLIAQTQVEDLMIQTQLMKTRRTRLQSAVSLAAIRLQQAQLNLTRTRIVAPYDGRVRQRSVDPSGFVNKGTIVANIYATDRVEIRLPLSDRSLTHLDLPKSGREKVHDSEERPVVHLTVRNGATEHQWQGELVRSEGAVDPLNRQLFVVAAVDNPYGDAHDGRPPLRVGTFVQANIAGRLLTDVYTVPRAQVRGEHEILLVDEQEQHLYRHNVQVIWRDEKVVVFRGPTLNGKLICTTPVVFAGDTVKVRIRGAAARPTGQPKRRGITP